jgi:hypothetical protein
VEPLESRTLFSTIAWTNRGTSTNDSDGFNALFGGNANQARLCFDRAIADWEEVIVNFNYSGGGNTFNLTVNTANLGGNIADGGITSINNGKPNGGNIRIDTATTHWLDPTVGDDAEFHDNITNPFAAYAISPGIAGVDLVTTALHEIGHVMGISTQFPALLINNFTTVTNVDDPNTTDAGNLVAVNIGGGPIEATLTNADPGHLWEGPGNTASNNAGLPWHPDVLMNPGRALQANERDLISDLEAGLLRDIYGYTITLPSTLNNMLVNPNFTTKQLSVVGQPGNANDLIIVQGSAIPGTLHVTVTTVGGGATYTEIVPLSQTNNIVVSGGEGNDILRLEYNGGKSTTFSGGNGNDFFDFSFATRNLSNITGNTQVNGGGGFDDIFVYDNSLSVATQYTITRARFDRPGWGGFGYAADIEHETMTTGLGADSVVIPSTFANQPVVVNSAGGNDTVFLGNSTNGMQSIEAEVQIQNDPAFTTVLMNNTADTGNRNWLVNDPNTGFGGVVGFAPALISWDNADINDITMLCGSGVDTGVIARLSETLNINNANGDNIDTIRVGDASAGGMQRITQGRAGGLTIDNDPDYTDLIFDDTGDLAARAITLDFVNGYNQLTGMCGATIRYDDGDTNSVTIRTGSGADTVNVLRTSLGTGSGMTNVTSVGGADAVNIGNSTSGTQEINGTTLYITNPPSFSTLSINDGPDTTARNVTIDTVNSSDVVQTITGLAPFSTIQWNTSDVNNTPNTITFGSGLDTVNIPRSRTNFLISTTGGNDVVTVGNNTSGCDDLGRNLAVQNPPSFTTLVVNDTGNTFGRTWTFRSDGTFGYMDLSPFLNISYKLADTSAVQLNGGGGADTFNVNQFTNGASLVVRGGGASDTLNIGNGNLAGNITNIASFSFDGQSGSDTLNVQNASVADQWSYTNLATTIQSQNIGGYSLTLGHASVEQLNVNAGSGTDVLTISGQTAGQTLALHGGNGTDAINLPGDPNVIVGPVYLYGDAGSNNLNQLTNSKATPIIAHLDQTSLGAFPGDNLFGAGGSVHFQNVTNMTLTMGSANDVVYAQPNATAAINLRGGNPTAAPGDTLNLALASVTGFSVNPGAPGAGTVTSSNRQTLTYSSFESGPNTDAVAPTVLHADINLNGVPAARVPARQQAVDVQFSENMGLVGTPSLTLTNQTTGQPVPAANIAVTFDSATNTAHFTFPGYANGILPDGSYHGVVIAQQTADVFGNTLAANAPFDFFFLQGDANHDRTVNLADFNILASHFGQTNATFSTGDFTYDGTVNLADFNALASRFGLSIGPEGTILGRVSVPRQVALFGQTHIGAAAGSNSRLADEILT